jgi:hypothetical protein
MPEPSATAPAAEDTPQGNPPAVEAALRAAALQAGVDPADVQVTEYREAEWPDACLGLALEGEMCAQAITPGYGGRLQAGEEAFEFRTDQSGMIVRLVPGAVNAAIDYLARELDIDAGGIAVSIFEAIEWPDSCLGVAGRGACVQVITPGYQVVLAVDGESYLLHTDRRGDNIILVGTPDLPAQIPQVTWAGMVDNVCQTLEVNSETLVYGPCDGDQASLSFISSPRFHEFQTLTQLFMPFTAETTAGEVQLSGPGEVTPSSTQQRMVAEWARLMAIEADSAVTEDPAGLALSWRREGGEEGYCDGLTIDVAGLAVASSCRSGALQELGSARHTTSQLKQLYEWIDGIRTYDHEITQLLETGAVTTLISFSGRGENKALDVDQRDMEAFALDLFTHLSQSQDPAEIESARQALVAYLDALQAGSYAEAAELYGGDFKQLQDYNPDIPADDHAALFQAACTLNGFVCDLSILNEISAAKITPTKYRFVVELQYPDETFFVLSSCCGADPSGESMVTQFEFYVEELDGRYLVLSLPVYSA